jgi:hypothetical protein
VGADGLQNAAPADNGARREIVQVVDPGHL